MKQMTLLEEQAEHDERPSVVLEKEMEEALVVLMASALAAVVLAIEESVDDDAE